MKEGRYCKNCHPNGEELAARHKRDPYHKAYKPWFGVCDKCKLLNDYWNWVGVDNILVYRHKIEPALDKAIKDLKKDTQRKEI